MERRLPRANLIFGVGIAFCKEVECSPFSPCPHFISNHRGEGGHCPAKLPLTIAQSGPSFSKVALFGLPFFLSHGKRIPGAAQSVMFCSVQQQPSFTRCPECCMESGLENKNQIRRRGGGVSKSKRENPGS